MSSVRFRYSPPQWNVAQLVERGAVNSLVAGSSPAIPVLLTIMKVFNNKVFKLNPNLTWETIDTPVAKVTIIDNFYEDFGAVVSEADKLPAAVTCCNKPGVSLDYRKSYAGNMSGTELPFCAEFSQLVAQIIGYSGYLSTNDSLMINCNMLMSDEYKDSWYNIHQDPVPSDDWNDRISTVIMMNSHYEKGEGLNFYYEGPPSDEVWTKKDRIRKAFDVQAKPNRAILFSPYMWHGAAFATDQFKSQFRYTQAIFTNLR